MATDNHQCGKTRYAEYVRKTDPNSVPNLASGLFAVVCDTCGYRSTKGSLIEFAGEELVQHTQVIGCADNVFLEEVDDSPQFNSQTVDLKPNDQEPGGGGESHKATEGLKENIVEQLAKLAALKEKGVLSNEEFLFIKKEIIKKLK